MLHSRVYIVHSKVDSRVERGAQQSGQWCTGELTVVHSSVYIVHSRVDSGQQQSGQWCTAEWTVVHSRVDSGAQWCTVVHSGAQRCTAVHSRADSSAQQS